MEKIKTALLSVKRGQGEPISAYLYDLNHLRSHVSTLISTMPAGCRYYYAVKANSEKEILKTLLPLVNGFEVASIGEIEKVRELDPAVSILFGGPGKMDSELVGAIRYCVDLIHVESIHELRRLNWIANQAGQVVQILLRVNLKHAIPNATMKMAGVPTQFGIDEAEIPMVLSMIREFRHINLQGFHFHAMSNNLDGEAHSGFIRYCVLKSETWEKEYGLPISVINVGGGIGVNYQDPKQIFPWSKLTQELENVTSGFQYSNRKLILECGRYTTASCGYYAAEVLDIKQNHGKAFVVIRGGTHHLRLPAAWKHNHPFTIIHTDEWKYPFPRPEIKNSTVTIAGELCTPNDILARDTPVERVRVGDIILFHLAGAYGWAISHHDFLSHAHPRQLYLD